MERQVNSAKVLSLCMVLIGCGLILLGQRLQNRGLVASILFTLISLMPLFSDHLDTRTQCFLVWASGLLLLLSVHLSSDYIWGWDIHSQYYYASRVAASGSWSPYIHDSTNSVISTVITPPIISCLLGLKLVDVYRIVYPIIGSMIPLNIYLLNRFRYEGAVASLAAYTFMFYYGFLKQMVDKSFLGELFLLLATIRLLERGVANRFLAVLFLIMMSLSHYGVSYLCLLCLFLLFLVSSACRLRVQVSHWTVLMIMAWVFSWSAYVSQSSVLETVVSIGQHLWDNIYDMIAGGPRTGIRYLAVPSSSAISAMYKALNILLLLFAAIGLLDLAVTYFNQRYDAKRWGTLDLIVIVFGVVMFCGCVITLGLGTDRILLMTLAVASCTVARGFRRLLGLGRASRLFVPTMGLFLAVYFLFSSGTVPYVFHEPLAYAVAFGDKPDWNVYSLAEVHAADWLARNKSLQHIAVSDPSGHLKSRDAVLLRGHVDKSDIRSFAPSRLAEPVCYVFLAEASSGWKEKAESTYGKIYSNANTYVYSQAES